MTINHLSPPYPIPIPTTTTTAITTTSSTTINNTSDHYYNIPPPLNLNPILSPYILHIDGIPPVGAKSRVETQIKLRLRLTTSHGDIVTQFRRLRLPDLLIANLRWKRHDRRINSTITSTTTTANTNNYIHNNNNNNNDTLWLNGWLQCASDPQRLVHVCSGCIQRETKRAARRKSNNNSNNNYNNYNNLPTPPTSVQSSPSLPNNNNNNNNNNNRSTITNDQHQSSFNNHHPLQDDVSMSERKTMLVHAFPVLDLSSGEVLLPTRIPCYCRHHKEKVGFIVHFEVRDVNNHVIARGQSPPILITDDHKTSKKSTLNNSTTTTTTTTTNKNNNYKNNKNKNNIIITKTKPLSKTINSHNNLITNHNLTSSTLSRGSKRPCSDMDDFLHNDIPSPLSFMGLSNLNNLYPHHQLQQQHSHYNHIYTTTTKPNYSPLSLINVVQHDSISPSIPPSPCISPISPPPPISSSTFSSSSSTTTTQWGNGSFIHPNFSSPVIGLPSPTPFDTKHSSSSMNYISSEPTPSPNHNIPLSISSSSSPSCIPIPPGPPLEPSVMPSSSTSMISPFNFGLLSSSLCSSTPFYPTSNSSSSPSYGNMSSSSSSLSTTTTPPTPTIPSHSIANMTSSSTLPMSHNDNHINSSIPTNGLSLDLSSTTFLHPSNNFPGPIPLSNTYSSSISSPSSTSSYSSPTSTSFTTNLQTHSPGQPIPLADFLQAIAQGNHQQLAQFAIPYPTPNLSNNHHFHHHNYYYNNPNHLSPLLSEHSDDHHHINSHNYTNHFQSKNNTNTNLSPSTTSLSNSWWPTTISTPTNTSFSYIERIVPSEGPLEGGIDVTLLGTGFQDDIIVYFGNIPSTTVYWSSNTLVCTLPPNTQSGPVTITLISLSSSNKNNNCISTTTPTTATSSSPLITFTYIDSNYNYNNISSYHTSSTSSSLRSNNDRAALAEFLVDAIFLPEEEEDHHLLNTTTTNHIHIHNHNHNGDSGVDTDRSTSPHING